MYKFHLIFVIIYVLSFLEYIIKINEDTKNILHICTNNHM